MTYFKLIIGMLLFGLLVVLGGGVAAAHEAAPLKSVKVRIGPYPVTVHYYNSPQAGQALQFAIVPDAGSTPPSLYRVTAIPGTMVDAVPVRATLEPDTHTPGAVGGLVYLPVQGQWLLSIEVEGPLGISFGDAAVLAETPYLLPVEVAWLIGLLPVWAGVGFIAFEARRAGRRPRPADGDM